MALKEFPELFEVFKKLQAEKAEIQSRSGPLREERDRIVAQTAPFEARARELAREIKAIELPRMVEIDKQLGAIAKSTGGQSLTNEG